MTVRLPDRVAQPGALRRSLAEAPEPKGFRVEIIRGRVVMSPTPSFKHGGIVHRVERQVRDQLPADRVVRQMLSVASPVDADDYCSPDLVVAPAAIDDEDDWLLDADAADLVVEVVSPSNAATDLTEKVDEYAEWRIPLYLVIDPRDGVVLLYSDPTNGAYRTVHKATFGERVHLPPPLSGVEIDTSNFRRYGDTRRERR